MRTTLGSHTGSVCFGLMIALAGSAACGSNAPSAAGAPKVGAPDAASSSPVVTASGDDDDAGALSDDASAADDAAAAPSGPDPNGVYVASSGSDSAVGSATAPLASVKAGITLATKSGRPLYLCAETYAESVLITAGVSIDGGRDCENGWAATTNFATLAPATGIPITINAGGAPVTLTHIFAKAADNYVPSGSSIAVLVSKSANVTIQHSQLTSGNAGDGKAPTSPTPVASPAPNGANGESLPDFGCTWGTSIMGECGVVATGGFSVYASCYGPGGDGGRGGNVIEGVGNQTGFPGGPGAFQGGLANGGQGGNVTGEGAGLSGTTGLDGQEGTPATVGIGTINASGYVPSNVGGAGTLGQSGGGGGGGAGGSSGSMGQLCSTNYLGGGGGQGGFGGCSGASSPASPAGGGSIALLSFGSSVQISDAIINTGAGGAGGGSVPGAVGQPGGQGGYGGEGSHADQGFASCTNNNTAGNANNGGAGGRGGKGGAGGPGGGGPSIGILGNTNVQVSSVSFNIGSGGLGGRAISGADAASGQTGAAVILSGK